MRQVFPHAAEKITARQHLAIDEAMLLDGNDAMRIWELSDPTVVLGRSSRIAEETNQDFCVQHGIEILRRCSGGASIVGGPGCLMYSVVLAIAERPELAKIDVAHSSVMESIAAATAKQIPEIEINGICDLTFEGRKCGGNALRVTRDAVLYHGTILYDFDLDLIRQCLNHAPRQPEYRRGRSHEEFVTNLALDAHKLGNDIAEQFAVNSCVDTNQFLPAVETLLARRYDTADWHRRH